MHRFLEEPDVAACAVLFGSTVVKATVDDVLRGVRAQATRSVFPVTLLTRLLAEVRLRLARIETDATLAALAATLRLYLEPEGHRRIPLYAMLGAEVASLTARGRLIRDELPQAVRSQLEIVRTNAYAGGGAAPLATIPSAGLALRASRSRASAVAAALRRARPPLVARTADDAVIVDLRAIAPERDADVARALAGGLA